MNREKGRLVRIAVFGSSGFLGRHVVETLGDEFDIVPLSRRLLPEFDLGNAGSYGSILGEVDVALLLVTATTPANGSIVTEIDRNIRPYAEFAEVAAKSGLQRVIFLSSGGTVYGRHQFLPITEDHPTLPIGAYGTGKLLVEDILASGFRGTSTRLVVLRPANPVGKGQQGSGVGLVAKAVFCAMTSTPIEIWGDGSVIRDFFDVSDLCEAIALTSRADFSIDRVFNIGSGVGRSAVEILDLVREVTGRELEVRILPARPADVPVNILSFARIKNELGWEPRTDIRQTIRELVSAYDI